MVDDANTSGRDPKLRRLRSRMSFRAVVEFLAVGICTIAFAFTAVGICASLLGRNAAGLRDFVEYWAAGQQLIHHGNPYGSDAVLALGRSVGYPAGSPSLIMANLPTALPLVLPLGFFGATVGEWGWSLCLLACLVISVRAVWRLHGSPKTQLSILGYTFAPALVCIGAGQVSLFVLLGLVLFLRLQRSNPFLAGASLWLCALKPHLFLPFGVVLLVWVVVSKSYRLVAGLVSTLALSVVITYVADPDAWKQYGRMMSAARVDRLAIPCLSNLLRRSINPDAMWIQYLPVVFACIWAVHYFRTHYKGWNWLSHGSLLLLVSVLVAPYSWLMDQAILMPALLHGLYLSRSRGLVMVLALTSAAIEIASFRGLDHLLHSSFYAWTTPAWLVWYLCATRSRNSTNAPILAGDDSLSGLVLTETTEV
jgi:hypothetical protein